MTTEAGLLGTAGEVLRRLPFVRDLAVGPARKTRKGGPAPDPEITVRTARGRHRFRVEIKTGILSYPVVETLLHQLGPKTSGWILVTTQVSRPMARFLGERGINFVDLQGNCRLAIGEHYVAQVEGGRPTRKRGREKGIRAAGHRVLFALLASPGLLRSTVRAIAEAAGTSRQAVVDMLARIDEEGWVAGKGRTRTWIPGRSRRALDRWLAGYMDLLRPRLRLGSWRTPEEDVDAREKRLAGLLGRPSTWKWGGGSAGWRLDPHRRSPVTVVHVDQVPPDLVRALRAVPDPAGHLLLLRFPGPAAHEGATSDTAHPLLVYAEMLAEGGERTEEAARRIFERQVRIP